MASQNLGLRQAVEALALLELEAVEAQLAVAARRLLLLPAEDREEALGLRLVADLASDLLDRLLVARAHQAGEHRLVLLAHLEPTRRRLRPAPEGRLGAARIGESRRAVERGDALGLEELCHAQHRLRGEHARRLLLVVKEHRLAHQAVVVVVERDGSVVVHDRLARVGLYEHQRGASDLEVAPIGLAERVAREARGELVVELVELDELAVEALGSRDVETRIDRPAADAVSLARMPDAADVHTRTVVPEVRRGVQDQIEQPLGRTHLLTREGRGVLRHVDLRMLMEKKKAGALEAPAVCGQGLFYEVPDWN